MKRLISLLVTFSFDYQINRWHKNDVGWCRQVSVSAMQPCPYFFISLPLLRE